MKRVLLPPGRAAAIVCLVAVLATAGAWPVSITRTGAQMSAAATSAVSGRPWQMPSVLVPIGMQIAGTVVKVDVGDRRYVSAGTVLLELDPRRYRAALTQARSRAAALTTEVKAARAGLAAGRHQAAAGVTAAVGSASTMPPLPSLPPVVVPQVDAATKAQLAQAQQQIVAARSEVLDTPEFHTGVDIAASTGEAIDAPAAGTVIFAGSLPANGTIVILDHGNGITTTYSHLSSYRVYVGEHVQRGQVIAKVGSTGWSTGPHLFFEIRRNGHPINPLSM